jgi:hypothetical protein
MRVLGQTPQGRTDGVPAMDGVGREEVEDAQADPMPGLRALVDLGSEETEEAEVDA